MAMSVDKRAFRILSDTYWSSAGWKEKPTVPAADLAYAKSAGVMFDPIQVTHDQAADWAFLSRRRVSREGVVRGFLASLSSRRLELRSALGSFAVLRNFPSHKWSRSEQAERQCPACGVYDRTNGHSEDLNVLNFERFKWGGVRHEDPLYAAFDLELFHQMDVPQPTDGDFAILRQTIEIASSIPKTTRLAELAKALAPIVPSNNAERRTLIGILGLCGILQDPRKPGYYEGFPPYASRERTPWYKDDWPYPVQWWNGAHGVNRKVFEDWFPMI
jgi:hypothetical protein